MDDPIEKLNMQHKEILNTLSKISSRLNTFVEKSDAIEIINQNQIQELSTILKEHFLFEDDFLYPVLKKCPQEKVRDLAAHFSEELGDIKSIFSKYKNDWASPDTIIQLYLQFFSESKALLKAMQNRIRKEDNGLFPYLILRSNSKNSSLCYYQAEPSFLQLNSLTHWISIVSRMYTISSALTFKK